MTDRWSSSTIVCSGGIVLNVDALTQGKTLTGTARVLQNYEPALEGGYKRLLGISKYDSATVSGSGAILGVKAALGGVFACRGTNIYYSTGSGWSAAINSAARTAAGKTRIISYSITAPVVVFCDGANYALKYNGVTDTLLNGAGAPTNPKYAELWRNRLVLAGYSANTSAITVSAPNDDEDYTGASGAIEINVGDVVVGLKTFRDELYIFCANSIHKLTGVVSSGLEVTDVTNSIGCLSGDSIQEVGGDVVFLAPDGIRSLAATSRVDDIELGLVSRSIQPLIKSVLANNFSADVYSSCIIGSKSQYRLFINDSATTEDDSVGFLGKLEVGRTDSGGLQYAWATLRGLKPYCADSAYVNNAEIAIIGDVSDGYVYRLESGNTFDGRNINAIYRSPDLIFEDATFRKVLQKIVVYAQVDGDVSFNLNARFDNEDSQVLQPETIVIGQTSSGATYGTAVYGTATYAQVQYPIFKNNLIGSCFLVAFQFSSSNDKAPHRIDSYQVTGSVKGQR